MRALTLPAVFMCSSLLWALCGCDQREGRTVHYSLGSAGGDIMTIKNLDTNDWRDVEMCLNARPREGYLYKISYLKSGDTAKVELNDFSKKDGTRFNFITTDITEIWIGGGGYDWTGKGKQ